MVSHVIRSRWWPVHLGLALIAALLVVAARPSPSEAVTPSAVPDSATAAVPLPYPDHRPGSVGAVDRRVPRHLVHHNFRKMTPTAWCSHHRVRCVDELDRRFHVFLVRHPHHRTHWGTAANRRAWHHRYVREWRARYNNSCGSSSCTKRRPRSLAADWSRFSRAEKCGIDWAYRLGSYRLGCTYRVPARRSIGTADRVWLLCEAGALIAGGTTSVFTGGVTLPVVIGVVAESTNCTTVWALMHFLNWP